MNYPDNLTWSMPNRKKKLMMNIHELPRWWKHSKMIIEQRGCKAKAHGNPEVQEGRVQSVGVVGGSLHQVPGAPPGVGGANVAPLPPPLCPPPTVEITWNAGDWYPTPKYRLNWFPHAGLVKRFLFFLPYIFLIKYGVNSQ